MNRIFFVGQELVGTVRFSKCRQSSADVRHQWRRLLLSNMTTRMMTIILHEDLYQLWRLATSLCMEWIVMIISRVLTTLWNEALGKLSASLSVDDQVERQQLLMMMLLLVLSMLLQQFSSPELMLCFALALSLVRPFWVDAMLRFGGYLWFGLTDLMLCFALAPSSLWPFQVNAMLRFGCHVYGMDCYYHYPCPCNVLEWSVR